MPGWKPPVISSRSLKPDGVPVTEMPSRETRSSLSSSSCRTSAIERSSPVRSSWAMWKRRALGLLEQLADRALEGEDLVLDVARRRQQAAHQRVLLDDPRVVADVARRRDEVRQRVDVGGAARLLELALAASCSQTVSTSTGSGSAFSFRRIIARKIRPWRSR